MRSWHKLDGLIRQGQHRLHRTEAERAHLRHEQAELQGIQAWQDTQLADIAQLIIQQEQQGGAMSLAELFDSRRHLAILLRQQLDLQQQQFELERELAQLDQRLQGLQQQLVAQSRQLEKFNRWRLDARRQARVCAEARAEREVEERVC